MYHIVYLTTNIVNNKIYIGKHSTYNIHDGYLGSGKALNKAIAKYGKENFKKEILYYCLSSKDAYEIEEQIVNKWFISNKHTYNLSIGGDSKGSPRQPGNSNPQSLYYLINVKGMSEYNAKLYLKEKASKNKNHGHSKNKKYSEMYDEITSSELIKKRSETFKRYHSDPKNKKFGVSNNSAINFTLITPLNEEIKNLCKKEVAEYLNISERYITIFKNRGIITDSMFKGINNKTRNILRGCQIISI